MDKSSSKTTLKPQVIEEVYEHVEYTRPNGTKGIRTINTLRSMTDTSFADTVDINNIVDKHTGNPKLDAAYTSQVGTYIDNLELQDYNQSVDRVLAAQEAFMALPAKTRDRFANDPAKLIEFMADQNNYDEGVKLGLVAKREEKQTLIEQQREPNAKNNDGEQKQNAKSDSQKTTST